MERGSGILCHISSLPGPFVIGDFGKNAEYFVRFLKDTNHRYWQILPLSPTDAGCGNSPYSSVSAFALNPAFMSPERLVDDGLVKESDIGAALRGATERASYEVAYQEKDRLFRLAFDAFKKGTGALTAEAFEAFCASEGFWLEAYARFMAAKRANEGRAWMEWSSDEGSKEEEELIRFEQFVLQQQWTAVKTMANAAGISIVGDLPLYVNTDSADVWSEPLNFRLDAERQPLFVSGCPPDYFAAEGQRWGTPVFDWKHHEETGFRWWVARLRRNFELFDQVRIDHFRGLVAYWEIPADAPSAKAGRWVPAPVFELFRAVRSALPSARLIAEDLGDIDEPVREAMKKLGLPGMKILQFAFDDYIDHNPYIPHCHPQNAVVYTGTHDNNTARGWFEREASRESRDRFAFYLGQHVTGDSAPWQMIRLALGSVADVAVIPMQDYLGQGSEGRMNVPGVASGNWTWRFQWHRVNDGLAHHMRRVNWVFGRSV